MSGGCPEEVRTERSVPAGCLCRTLLNFGEFLRWGVISVETSCLTTAAEMHAWYTVHCPASEGFASLIVYVVAPVCVVPAEIIRPVTHEKFHADSWYVLSRAHPRGAVPSPVRKYFDYKLAEY